MVAIISNYVTRCSDSLNCWHLTTAYLCKQAGADEVKGLVVQSKPLANNSTNNKCVYWVGAGNAERFRNLLCTVVCTFGYLLVGGSVCKGSTGGATTSCVAVVRCEATSKIADRLRLSMISATDVFR